jgi:ATP-dependent DNA helicase DinG
MDADALTILDAVVGALDGEKRDGQRELTTAVVDAIANGRHLVAEAPTGSGKSFAYLAAAIASGQRVVVATSTIALQSQLVDRDLPALQQHGGVDFTYAILKGRANYVCRAKLGAAAKPDALFEVPVTKAFPRQLEKLNAFARSSASGDRAEITDAINDASWAAVSCSSAECPGRTNCPEGDSCFAELARENARDKSILVVNHALYCTHLASGGTVLPEHDVVIIDEAHAFANSATNMFGVDLSAGALARLVPLLRRAAVEEDVVDGFATAAKTLEAAIDDTDGRIHLGDNERLGSALLAAAERLATASAKLAQSDDDSAKRTGQLATARLEALRRLGAPGADDVMWTEAAGRAKRLRLAPVVVSDRIAATMLAEHPVVAVSATLGGAAPFTEFARQFGLEPGTYEALLAPSSFDWRTQGTLYVGRDLPDPGRARDAWLADAGERLVQLVNAAGGRTLVLCTSKANVEHFAALLREHTDHDVLAQGDASVGHLSRTFLEEETSVLVGTRSFWQGIDTPGVCCVLVVIEPIPLPTPGDPL